jgi:hypothetical protein
MASRISGITPATISLLLIHLKKRGVHGLPTLDGSAELGLANEMDGVGNVDDVGSIGNQAHAPTEIEAAGASEIGEAGLPA